MYMHELQKRTNYLAYETEGSKGFEVKDGAYTKCAHVQ